MVPIRWYERPPAGRPAQIFERLQREVNRLFASVSSGEPSFRANVFPPVNISEDDENLYIRAEMSGIDPNELEIAVEGESVTLRGEKKIETEEEVGYHRREREGGRFRRVVTVPGRIEAEGVSAVFRDGILKLTLPRAKETPPKQVKITSE